MTLDDETEVHKRVRRKHTDTEREAAMQQLPKIAESCAKVLDALDAHGPMTDYELVQCTGIRSARRRRADLKNAGLVLDSGVRREHPETGSSMIVWEKA